MTTETFFANFLANPKITTFRLRNFMRTSRTRFDADNKSGEWEEAIRQIDSVLPDLNRELGEVDETGNTGKGLTQTTNAVLAAFSQAMSEEEPFVKRALKGERPEAYLAFYPAGLSEYNRIAKEDALTLLERVEKAAAKYAAQLGQALSDKLGGFARQYRDARDRQTGNTGSLAQNRGERTAARKAAEPVMLSIMHDIGRRYPGNVAVADQFFNLNELYPPVRGDKGAAHAEDPGISSTEAAGDE